MSFDMTNPETCRHWILTPYGWSTVACFSCGNVFARDKLPFGREKSDYIWSDRHRCWEYQSPELRKRLEDGS